MSMRKLVLAALLFTGFAAEVALYRPAVRNFVTCRKAQGGTWVAWGILAPIGVALNVAEGISQGNAYADCKDRAEALGYERMNTSGGTVVPAGKQPKSLMAELLLVCLLSGCADCHGRRDRRILVYR